LNLRIWRKQIRAPAGETKANCEADGVPGRVNLGDWKSTAGQDEQNVKALELSGHGRHGVVVSAPVRKPEAP